MAGGYDVAFLERSDCGSDIATMRFERPDGYRFSAGQWFRLQFATADGPHAETFSHCSAPSDPFLEMTTRLSSSPFKIALAGLVPGAKVHIAGPGGHLALSDQVTRVAILVGGVGITPIRSILRDAVARGRRFDDALLLYGNRDETCAPFLGEFEAMGGIGVRVVACYERPSAQWDGESGFITAEMVRRHFDMRDERPFVVTGPPAMVSAMELVLDELEIPEPRRVVEKFSSGT
jgi:ferredoxin-NADP reductase